MTTFSRGTAFWLAALSLCLVPSRADAYCFLPEGSSWAAHRTVRVRIHADLHNQMQHEDGTTWTRSELEDSVQWTLSRLNESARGDVPWLYLDTKTQASSCTWFDADCTAAPMEDPLTTCGAADTIHIVPSNCSQLVFDAVGTRQVIVVQTSDAAIALPQHALYGHHLDTEETWAFEPRLLHEFGHALGLNHPSECAGWSAICPADATGCAVMGAEASPATELFTLDDANGLEAMWRRRDAPVTRRWERALPETSFSTSTEAPLGATSYFSASSSPLVFADTTQVTIVGYHPTADIPVVWSWSWISRSMTSLRSPNLHRATGPLGVAQSRTERFVTSLAPRMTDDSRRWRRRLTVSARDVAARSVWSTAQAEPVVNSAADTDVAGISTTQDPVSGFLVHAFRDGMGRVLLQGSSGGTSSFSNVIETNIHSMSTPRVACAGPGTARNCMLTVVDPGNPWSAARSQRLQWLDFSWTQSGTTASWDYGLLHTTRFTPQGEHSLAVARNPDGAYQYSIAYAGRGPTDSSLVYVTRRRPPSTTFSSMGPVREDWGAQPHVAFGGVGTSLELLALSRRRTL